MIKPWAWTLSRTGTWELKNGQGDTRASIWLTGSGEYTWHTWNENGTGGENDGALTLNQAKDECVAAIVRQGWAPGGWTVSWG